MDDYPNQGDRITASDIEAWTPEPDTEAAKAEAEERLKLASSVGVIEDVMHYLETKRTQYAGLSIIEGVTPSSSAEDIKSAVLLNQAMLAELDALLRDFRITYGHLITETPMSE